MKKMYRYVIVLFVCATFIVGCDAGKPKKTRKPEEPQPVAENGAGAANAGQQAAGQAEQKMETVRAGVGVTGKADFAKDGANSIMSPITVPLGELFNARERAVFDIQIPQAMNFYKAENDNRVPATEEVFMRDIIEKNSIKLPKLKEGHSYSYDPATGTLNVVRPARQ
ncbi:MAG: hypothetical protein ACRC2T_17680 [Thermoguttaceae bacterium]